VAISLAFCREAFFVGLLSEDCLVQAWRGRIFRIAVGGALLFCATRDASPALRSTEQPRTQHGGAQVVTDEAGRRVAIPAEVKRIVTLAPNLTETIYALGLDDRLAGDTDYCDFPPAAKSKPHVGSLVNPSIEAIVALHPDLVLATTSINRGETVEALSRLGIPVYTSNSRTVREMLNSVARLAKLIGAEARGEALVTQLRARLDALQAHLADRPLLHVLFVVWEDPLITIGQNTFIADALRWAGAESLVLSKQNWPHLSFEEVVRLQPDYIIFTRNHTGSDATELAGLRSRPGWKGLEAVQMGHVISLSEEVARPSPGLVDAIEQLAHELHPELFPAQSEIRPSSGVAHERFPVLARTVKEGDQCAR
jgi:iron complex transport system substrate-binding protein